MYNRFNLQAIQFLLNYKLDGKDIDDFMLQRMESACVFTWSVILSIDFLYTIFALWGSPCGIYIFLWAFTKWQSL